MNKPLLQVENLSTRIATDAGSVRAVDGVSFDVARGEVFALLGESGCGKSITALSIMRLLPDSGRIVAGSVGLDGIDLLRQPEAVMRDIRGRRIAMIFQEPMLSLNPVMNVGDQIAEALALHTMLSGAGLEARVIELLGHVGIADPQRRRRDYPFQFSGGMKQRAMIAIALACSPALLIADEPTTALDVTIQAQILDLLRRLQRESGMSMLLITHDLAVVSAMAQQVAVMYAGEIIETAPRDRFFAQPAHPYSRKLFEALPGKQHRSGPLQVIRGSVPPLTHEFKACRFVERCDYAWELCRARVPPWYEPGGGQRVKCHLFGPAGAGRTERTPPAEQASRQAGAMAQPPDASLLAVQNLKVHFPVRGGVLKRVTGHIKAVDGVSFSIAAGRTLGLVGESGSGKTTVGKALLRLLEPTAGSVRFDGEDWTQLTRSELRARRHQAQIVFQDPYSSLDPRMRIAEIIEEGMVALGVGHSAEERAARIDNLLTEVGLAPDMKHRYPHEFSGGQRQRIAVARALAVEPQLVVCDEPTSALDVSVQAQILNLLKSLQQRHGLAYLFITHNIAAVEYLAHEVAVMYQGRIVEHGAVDEVLIAPRHPYTRALLAAVPTVAIA
ncbi:MAG TPA: dipeptide ABC transporter ATP-binding protein [Burkholderiales bacterium]|nr:dipeptide ABC transporter ATP-binding protein [Burkholderiales bacterium]